MQQSESDLNLAINRKLFSRRRKNRQHLAAGRQIADQSASFADHFQSDFPTHDAGDTSGGILAHTVAHNHVGLQVPGLEQFCQPHLNGENRRLGPGGVMDVVIRLKQECSSASHPARVAVVHHIVNGITENSSAE